MSGKSEAVSSHYQADRIPRVKNYLLVWLMGLIYELFLATPCKHPHILVLGWE